MQYFKILFFISTLFTSLQAGIYLEQPVDFHPKAATVGCCFLHYQDKILLLHRQDSKPEGNRWGIPGGKLESGEPIIEAIAREVYEETGLRLDIKKMHTIGKVYIKVPNFDFEYYMVKYEEPVEHPESIKINFKEHKGFTWVTPQDALRLPLMTDEDTCFEIVFGLTR